MMLSSRLGRRSYTTVTNQRKYLYHQSSGHASPTRTLGLRREDKSRWERRTALTPAAVQRLIHETGTDVYVQPSTKRIYSDADYKKVMNGIERRQASSGVCNFNLAFVLLGRSHCHRRSDSGGYYSWDQRGA